MLHDVRYSIYHFLLQEELVKSQGWDLIICCLVRDSIISKVALELLHELLQDRCGWNVSVCKKLYQQGSAIIFLVTLLKGSIKESSEIAESILLKLLEIDEANISQAAKAGWYKPLIDRIVQGKTTYFIPSNTYRTMFLSCQVPYFHEAKRRYCKAYEGVVKILNTFILYQ